MNTTAPNTCAKCGKPILEGSPRGLCPLCLISAVAKSDEPPPPESSAPELDDLRRSFPHLEILEPLGAGGMGRVYKTRQPHLDRLVALKVLPPAYANDPEWVERFTREARALARLNHPNIVQVYDFGETAPDENGQRFPFLIMEFVDGVNLRQALRSGALTAREALSIVPSVCGALQYAHDQGVLHRDIKPENILLDTSGRVKIADFGLAKLRGDGAPNLTLTATGARLGTTAYMAPEQIEKPHQVDHRADIYSLGVVFYELLTGELPLGRFAAPSEKAGTDPRLDTIVFRTLEKERERRFQTATAMQSEVETVANTPAPEAPDTTPVVPVESVASSARGRKIALVGAWLHIVPLVLAVCFLPMWANIALAAQEHRRTEEMLRPFIGGLAAFVIPSALALIAGDVLTLVALFGSRFRARWFFWWNVFHWTLLSFVFVGILPLLYVLAKWREFFPSHAMQRATAKSAATISVPSDQVPPRSPVALIFALLLLPVMLLALGLTFPMAARRGAVGGISFAEIAILLPMALLFYAGAVAGLTWLFRRLRRAGLSGVAASAVVGLVMVVLPIAGCVPLIVAPYLALRGASLPAGFLNPSAVMADVVTPEAAPFIGRLPQGSIELLSVSYNPHSGGSRWNMDGSPVRDDLPAKPAGPEASPGVGERGYEFVFRTEGLPPGTSLVTWQVESARGWGSGESSVPGETRHTLAASLPSTLRATDVRVAFGIGEWEGIFESSQDGPGSTNPTHRGVTWQLAWTPPIETKDGLTVTNWNAPRNPNWETRVVAVRKDGTEVATRDHSRANNQSSFRFRDLPLSELKAFRFEVRQLQWVEFRGIKLAPSKATRPAASAARTALQDEAIVLARTRLEAERARFAQGVTTDTEVAAATRDLAIAEARGDAAKIAEARVVFSEAQTQNIRAKREVGTATAAELVEAETALNAARQELQRVREGAPPGR